LQAPQCCADLVRSTHAPPHSVVPGEHENEQRALSQNLASAGQLRVHDPQLVGFVRSVSQPFAGSPSQSSRPSAQLDTRHLPGSQRTLVPAGAEHGSQPVSVHP
jgi:hypothetical protein